MPWAVRSAGTCADLNRLPTGGAKTACHRTDLQQLLDVWQQFLEDLCRLDAGPCPVPDVVGKVCCQDGAWRLLLLLQGARGACSDMSVEQPCLDDQATCPSSAQPTPKATCARPLLELSTSL